MIQNLRPGVLERLGLDGGALRAEKPSLIWCDLGAFGRMPGRCRERPATTR